MAVSKMSNGVKPYSLQKGIRSALQDLLGSADGLVPEEVRTHLRGMSFESESHGDDIGLPCPLKETEAVTALKAVEASTVAAITDLRFGMYKRDIKISIERATCFLFAAYLSTVDGMAKGDPNAKSKLKGGLRKTLRLVKAHIPRYGSSESTVNPLSTIRSQSVRNSDSWGILSSPWIARSHDIAQ